MKPESALSLYNITHVGSLACHGLTPGQHGHVLAAFSKAVYLQTDTGELFWITTEDAPMHQRCAQVSGTLPGLSAESSFKVDDHTLRTDTGHVLDLERTTAWVEPGGDLAIRVSSLYPQVQAFFVNLDYFTARGFGTFIPNLLLLSQGEPADLLHDSTDPVLSYVQPLVRDLTRACLENNRPDIYRCSKRLIGLGSGLTPSGDDFIGGMAFAVNMLKLSYPDLALPDFILEIDDYRPRTHPISFTLLSDLAYGHAIAPLHQITNGLMCGKTLADLQPYVSQLTSVGHSTGWDLLAGLLAGLLTTYQSHNFFSSFKIKYEV